METVLEFLWDTRVECIVTARRPLEEEEEGEDTEKEEGGLEPPYNVPFLCLSLSPPCSAVFGEKEKGEPYYDWLYRTGTRYGHVE